MALWLKAPRYLRYKPDIIVNAVSKDEGKFERFLKCLFRMICETCNQKPVIWCPNIGLPRCSSDISCFNGFKKVPCHVFFTFHNRTHLGRCIFYINTRKLPIVLLGSMGSQVMIGLESLDGRPTPAWFTAHTLNWYMVFSFKPITG